MTAQEQATQEIDEILLDMFAAGLSGMASISLPDTRRAMIVAWVRGYEAACEAKP